MFNILHWHYNEYIDTENWQERGNLHDFIWATVDYYERKGNHEILTYLPLGDKQQHIKKNGTSRADKLQHIKWAVPDTGLPSRGYPAVYCNRGRNLRNQWAERGNHQLPEKAKKISLCSCEHKAYLVFSANLFLLRQHAVNPLKK